VQPEDGVQAVQQAAQVGEIQVIGLAGPMSSRSWPRHRI
jgi:hypothetical protein